MAYSIEVRERAYALDPECWVPYFGQPKEYKQAMEHRRTTTLNQAQAEADDIAHAVVIAAIGDKNPRMLSFMKSRIGTLQTELTLYSYALGKAQQLKPTPIIMGHINTLNSLVDARQAELEALNVVQQASK